jgi:Type IV secretion system pilin
MRTRIALAVLSVAGLAVLVWPSTALAASGLDEVIDNLRLWVAGLLAALATLFLMIGGVRYVLAGGDPGSLERAKGSIKAAIVGYALALLAPVIAQIVRQVING